MGLNREELHEQIARLMGSNELLWTEIRQREAEIAENVKEASRLMNILMKLAGK